MNLNKTFFNVTVQSTHIDQFKHLNNAVYLEFFEWARWDWGRKTDIDFEEKLKAGIGPVVVRIEIDFIKEVKFNDQLIIETDLEDYSQKTFTLKQIMFNKNKEKTSQCKVIIVFVDTHTKKSVLLPEEISKLF